jgi:hypothetical protein
MINYAEWRAKCEELMGTPIDWVSESAGILECPFKDLHTTKNAYRDTALYLSGFPHIHCLHESCKERLRDINRFLRIQLTGTSQVSEDFAPKQSRGQVEFFRKNREMLIEKYTPKIREWSWAYLDTGFFLKKMFDPIDPQDWLWIGSPEMTGMNYPNNFGSSSFWIHASPLPKSWRFICANPLKKGVCNRTNNNVAAYKYLVLESDGLNFTETRAMFEAAEDLFMLRLKAIVFSGNKSLHGWFDHPGMEWLESNKSLLVAMGFDGATMRPTQPVRLAGAIRENGKVQSLLWLK